MASNGIKRLKDKHVKKKANQEMLAALLEKIMPHSNIPEISDESQQTPPQKGQWAPKVVHFPNIPNMGKMEREYFERIWVKLAEIHEEPEHYRIIAESTSKMFAQIKRLEEQMECDGGPILTTNSGKFYPHPAMKIIQNFQGQILAYLKAMGLTFQGRPGRKKENEETTSIFAQFQ